MVAQLVPSKGLRWRHILLLRGYGLRCCRYTGPLQQDATPFVYPSDLQLHLFCTTAISYRTLSKTQITPIQRTNGSSGAIGHTMAASTFTTSRGRSDAARSLSPASSGEKREGGGRRVDESYDSESVACLVRTDERRQAGYGYIGLSDGLWLARVNGEASFGAVGVS